MKKLLRRGAHSALCLALFWTNTAQGQLFHELRLPASQARAVVPTPTYIARVVDARSSKSGVGWLSTGLENSRRLARFPQGLEQELTTFLGHVPRLAEARPLVMVVRRMGLAEQAGSLQEYALAELVADIYYQQADGYQLVHHATELACSRALNVTGQHPQTLTRTVLQALAPLGSVQLIQALAGPILTWQQVLAGPAPVPYPMQMAPVLRAGIYQTVAQFQQNTPQEGTEWKMTFWASVTGTFPVSLKLRTGGPDGKWHEGQDVWGFCDGRQVYVRHGGNFYPLQRTAAGYEYLAPVYIDPRQQTMAMIYTPVGAMARQSPKLAAATLRLWPDTGFSSEETPPTTRADAPAAAATVVVYRRPDAAPDKAVLVHLNGQAVGTLRVGEYLTLPMPAGAPTEISVCGRTERETCFSFRPDLRAPNYLDCRLGSTTQLAPTLRLVSAEAGAAVVHDCVSAVP